MAEIFNFYVQDNRTIQFPKSNLLEPIMQEDYKVATWRFRIPKTLNGIDMSGWAWWFVYTNAKNHQFSELLTLVDDIDEPGSFSTADYDIDYSISYNPGSFSFSLEAINAESGGAITGEWHTKTYSHKVDKTLQGNQAQWAETESDIISALIVEVQNKVAQLVGGATPEPVSLIADMTDPKKVYLYVGSETGESTNYWYYYNGSAWVAGGLYASGITVDSTPTQGSANAVSSGGVYETLENKPETATPEETNADFYLTDENGNVLMELADGHVKTKYFDSSNINTEQDVEVQSQLVDADSDLEIVDSQGNAIVVFSYGNIRTKNFSSDNGIYKLVWNYSGESGKATINHSFHKGAKIALHFVNAEAKGWRTASSSKVSYSYITRNGDERSLGSEYGYNFLRVLLPEDAVSICASYPSNITSAGSVAFCIYAEASYPRKPTIIMVSPDGSKDYTSIRDACDAVPVDVCELNPYEIHVYPGTYNILDDYTAEEIAEDGFKGLFLYNGMSIIGVGRRSEIILTASLSVDDYTVAKRNDISTLNLDGNTLVENVTIKAYNIRYAIHDEGSGAGNHLNNHVVKNCKLWGRNLTSGAGGNTSFGAGCNGYKAIKLEDCDFSDTCAVHTNTNLIHPIIVEYHNCSARRFRLTDNDSGGVICHAYMYDCKASTIEMVLSGTHAQYFFLHANAMHDVIVSCPAGYVYETGDTRRFNDITISAGKAVKIVNLYDSRSNNLVATNDINNIYGVSIGTVDDDTIIQIAGYINSNILGLTGLAVGDYLTVDQNGNVISGGIADNAIAQVKLVESNGVAYAKLMF